MFLLCIYIILYLHYTRTIRKGSYRNRIKCGRLYLKKAQRKKLESLVGRE